MKKIYGYIYRITNKGNNRLYIGQAKHSFENRYGGKSIKNVYKTTHNLDLKTDIEEYFDDKYWNIETEFDMADSHEELNRKEYATFLLSIFERSEIIKREDIEIESDGFGMYHNNLYFRQDYIPTFLYNWVTPMKVKSRDRAKRYIYTTDKLCVMFKSQQAMRDYKEYYREITDKYATDKYDMKNLLNVFWGDGGYFYIPWIMKWRMINNKDIPRVNNIKKCYTFQYCSEQGRWGYYKNENNNDLYEKQLVTYTGLVYIRKKIYKPVRKINISRIEVYK